MTYTSEQRASDMRTVQAKRVIHSAQALLAEAKAGKPVPQLTLDWARAIVRANPQQCRALQVAVQT